MVIAAVAGLAGLVFGVFLSPLVHGRLAALETRLTVLEQRLVGKL